MGVDQVSVRVMSLVWEINLPDSEKIVLLALADCANDEGQCWPSMATLARKCSKTDRTVQAAMKSLVTAGHVTRIEVPGRGCRYCVHPVIASEKASPPKPLPPEAASPRKRFPPKGATGTPEAASDKPSRTIIPSDADASSGKRATRLPADWQPDLFQPGTVAFDTVSRWEPGMLERELSKFRDHWAAASGSTARKHDWQAAWRTWVIKSDEWQQKRGSNAGYRNSSTGGAGGQHGDGFDEALGIVAARGSGNRRTGNRG
jgi:hypothetical protein